MHDIGCLPGYHRAVLDFCVAFFGARFSATVAVRAAEKHAPRIRGNIQRTNSADNSCFSLHSSLCFSLFSGHLILPASF